MTAYKDHRTNAAKAVAQRDEKLRSFAIGAADLMQGFATDVFHGYGVPREVVKGPSTRSELLNKAETYATSVIIETPEGEKDAGKHTQILRADFNRSVQASPPVSGPPGASSPSVKDSVTLYEPADVAGEWKVVGDAINLPSPLGRMQPSPSSANPEKIRRAIAEAQEERHFANLTQRFGR